MQHVLFCTSIYNCEAIDYTCISYRADLKVRYAWKKLRLETILFELEYRDLNARKRGRKTREGMGFTTLLWIQKSRQV